MVGESSDAVAHQLGRLCGRLTAVEEQVRAGREDHARDKHDLLSALSDWGSRLEAKIEQIGARVSAIEMARAHEDGFAEAEQRRTADHHEGHIRWGTWIIAAGTVLAGFAAVWALR